MENVPKHQPENIIIKYDENHHYPMIEQLLTCYIQLMHRLKRIPVIYHSHIFITDISHYNIPFTSIYIIIFPLSLKYILYHSFFPPPLLRPPAVLQLHRAAAVEVLLGAVATAVASDGLGGDGEPVNVNEAIGKP